MWYVLRRLGAFDSADYIYKLDVYNDLDIFINLQVLSYTRIMDGLKIQNLPIKGFVNTIDIVFIL